MLDFQVLSISRDILRVGLALGFEESQAVSDEDMEFLADRVAELYLEGGTFREDLMQAWYELQETEEPSGG